MYKYISAVLLTALLVAGGALWWQDRQHSKQRRDLNNALARTEKTLQETETVSSRRAVELEDIETKNKELQKILKDRDESILALTETNLRLRDKYFKIKNAKENVVDKEGNEIPDGEPIPDDARVKVEFEHVEEPLKVSGFTLTNPAYAEVKLNWTRDLRLSLILTKTDEDTFRVYLDSENSDVDTTEINLSVDPTLLEHKWYEKIGVGSSLVAGEYGGQLGLRVYYDFWKNVSMGIDFMVLYDGAKAKTFYGLNVGWYPFRK